jgi:formate dehydrogenase beta subunit
MLNRDSNVFPGILGAPATGRASRPAAVAAWMDKPVAICRLKRVAADLTGDITDRLPRAPKRKRTESASHVSAPDLPRSPSQTI